jgi:23S rRNA (uracil1939-C5)-methyltransferase
MSGEQAEVWIERLAKSGHGVASYQGRAVFIEGGLPSERVRIQLERTGKALRGRLIEVLSPSPSRRQSPCPLSRECGGCDWLHLDEEAQRQAREEIVLSALERMGGIQRHEFQLLPTVIASPPLGYRRRAGLHLRDGQLCFYGRSSHRSVPIHRCPALVDELSELPAGLAPLLSPMGSEIDKVELLAGQGGVSFAVRLRGASIRPSQVRWCEEAVKQLRLAGAILVPAQGSPVLIGKPVLQEPGTGLYLRPDAFAQVNAQSNAALREAVLEQLSPSAGERILELYCGNGNFTFSIADSGPQVVAVESSPTSLELARRTGREAGVQTVRFIQGDTQAVCQGLLAERAQFDAILADPPRSGVVGIGSMARRFRAARVVYVGCDPATLARDAGELVQAGFRPASLRILDLFPQTRHVEAVLSMAASSDRL